MYWWSCLWIEDKDEKMTKEDRLKYDRVWRKYPKGKRCRAKWFKTEKGKAARARCSKRYFESKKGKKTLKKSNAKWYKKNKPVDWNVPTIVNQTEKLVILDWLES